MNPQELARLAEAIHASTVGTTSLPARRSTLLPRPSELEETARAEGTNTRLPAPPKLPEEALAFMGGRAFVSAGAVTVTPTAMPTTQVSSSIVAAWAET